MTDRTSSPAYSGVVLAMLLLIGSVTGAQVGTPLIWVLIIGGIATSLLTLYALMRAWNLAFWREQDDESPETEARIAYLGDAPAADEEGDRRRIPRIMTAATGGMVAVTLALTVFAGPLLGFSQRAAEQIEQGVTLVGLQTDASHSDESVDEGVTP